MPGRVFVLAVAGLAAVAFSLAGCGSSVDSESGSVNAPCTRDDDCMNGLTCVSGACTGPPVEAGPSLDATSPEDSAPVEDAPSGEAATGAKDAAVDG